MMTADGVVEGTQLAGGPSLCLLSSLSMAVCMEGLVLMSLLLCSSGCLPRIVCFQASEARSWASLRPAVAGLNISGPTARWAQLSSEYGIEYRLIGDVGCHS